LRYVQFFYENGFVVLRDVISPTAHFMTL
jgi:hypothetical protein